MSAPQSFAPLSVLSAQRIDQYCAKWSVPTKYNEHKMGKSSPKGGRGKELPNREEYHLEFRNPTPGKKFKEDIDAYLRGVFENKTPLQYDEHCKTGDGGILVCQYNIPAK